MVSYMGWFHKNCRPLFKVKKSPKYELTGVINHHGIGAEGGHYTAETKRGRKWFKVDDNKVSEVRLNEVLHTDNKRTPYLLECGFIFFIGQIIFVFLLY